MTPFKRTQCASTAAIALQHPRDCGGEFARIEDTRIRSWTSATKALGSVIIIVQDFSVSPVARSFHSSQRPANVIGSPSAHVI